jgi:tryptophan synthase alpha chain
VRKKAENEMLESEISIKFKNSNGSLFIPYFSLGDPNYEASLIWADAIISGGGDILELGIPFSDPVADGPVIQRAFKRAFEHPFQLERIFSITRSIKDKHPLVPIVYLTYFNPIYHTGVQKFLEKAKASGVSGLIIPDLPFDSPETEVLFESASRLSIDLIHLVTPATEKSRIRKMKLNSSGFVYYVTSFGVTGERSDFSQDLEERIRMVRNEMGLPVSAGFGISTPDQAAKIGKFSDGIIIGSSIQRIIEDNGSNPDVCAKKLEEYCRGIRQSIS